MKGGQVRHTLLGLFCTGSNEWAFYPTLQASACAKTCRNNLLKINTGGFLSFLVEDQWQDRNRVVPEKLFNHEMAPGSCRSRDLCCCPGPQAGEPCQAAAPSQTGCGQEAFADCKKGRAKLGWQLL